MRLHFREHYKGYDIFKDPDTLKYLVAYKEKQFSDRFITVKKAKQFVKTIGKR